MQATTPSRRPRLAPLLLAAACSLAGGTAAAVEPATGLVVTAGIGGGAELGLGDRKAGVAEAEFSAGWEHAPTGIRPELALGIGFAPDSHVAVRPGLRYVSPDAPIQVRVALDWSNARDEKRWRWNPDRRRSRVPLDERLLAPRRPRPRHPAIGPETGMPLLLRGGAAFRF